MTFISRLDLKKALNPCTYIAITAVLIGVIVFQSRWHYAESGHGVLLSAYLACCIVLLIALHYRKVALTACAVILMGLIIGYASLKFDWREDYFLNAHYKTAPPIDRYITNYPTFEQNLLSHLTGQPRWFEFSSDCFEPALKNKPMGEDCHSAGLIQEHYNIDIRQIIQSQYILMQETAEKIANGKMRTIESYRDCLNDRSCAYLPLLPPQSVADDTNLSNADDLKIRRQFWSIRNYETIQPEICDFMSLCHIMRDANVIIVRATD